MKQIKLGFFFQALHYPIRENWKKLIIPDCITIPSKSIIQKFPGDQSSTDYNHGIWFGTDIFHTYPFLRNANSKDLKIFT